MEGFPTGPTTNGGSGDLNMTKQTNLPSLMGNRMNLFISTIFSLFTKMASIGHQDKHK
jgi:hypothetical protein